MITMMQVANDRRGWCCGMIIRDGWVTEAAPKIRDQVEGTPVDWAISFLMARGGRVIAWWAL